MDFNNFTYLETGMNALCNQAIYMYLFILHLT